MALNPQAIGRSYAPDHAFSIDRQKIREFADAIGDPDPAYRVATAEVIAPPTFPALFLQSAFEVLAADPDLGLDRTRMVHGDQSFTYRRPLVAGERVTVTASITDIGTRGGVELLSVRYDVATVEGEPVLTATALLVFRLADERSEDAA
ncbi:acyl dehydratase [Amycolatopsis lexingtonensis]|uniref:Acyl dehydratase n=1 Tax=Amycolatopsis lexingtonensis TaxID=218822 RepID=A0ABR9IF50_9PSEU|nr:MaoC family dehydratase N-terminal domain-containing protein [Amycolatopsis lexingtonensis]MBE1501812.1 acyl dehydratase [Amycolatopsis lexingtonensis]